MNKVNTDKVEVTYEPNINNEPCMGSFFDFIGKLVGCCCLFTTCGTCCNPYKTVTAGNKGVITRFGTIKSVVDTGLHTVNPITEQLHIINIMTHAKKLSNQSVITRDTLPVTIDGVVYYRIGSNKNELIKAKYGLSNISYAIDELAHATLREVIGHYTLSECLSKRKELATTMQQIVADKVQNWGVIIDDIQIIDIVIPQHIQDMLASGAVAQRDADAQIIMAQASVKSAHLMREAADQLNTPAAMQMRLLDTYKHLAESQNTKIIFMPMDHKSMDNLTASTMGNEVSKDFK